MPLSSVVGAQSIVKPGVCTSSTRPASPFEGQVIYETDTDLLRIWTGAAWRTLNAAAATNGSVLQVVNGTYSTGVSTSVGGYSDTGLTATITPSSTSSKILVIVNQAGVQKSSGNAGNGVIIALLRGSTYLFFPATGAAYTGTAVQNIVSVGATFLDSPATTSAVTYKTQFANVIAAASVGVQISVGSGFPESSMCLMEISA